MLQMSNIANIFMRYLFKLNPGTTQSLDDLFNAHECDAYQKSPYDMAHIRFSDCLVEFQMNIIAD